MDKVGTIVVNWGSMFSGKSEELLRLVRRAKIAGESVVLVKPQIDDRYSVNEVVTHAGDRFDCAVLRELNDIFNMDLSGVDVVGIDEGQFFGDQLIDVCRKLKYRGIRVIVSGLDMWSSGEPVVNMALLAAIANKSVKFNAVCVRTGKDAYISHCLVAKDEDVKIGGGDEYIAVCEDVHLRLLASEKSSVGVAQV